MKYINRYTIQDENQIEYASFIDYKKAFECLEIANMGQMLKSNWQGKHYAVVEKSVEVSKNIRTLTF